MKPLFTILVLVLFITSCSPDNGDGMFSAYNVCIWDNTTYSQSLSASAADTNEELFDASDSKYLAQNFTLNEDKELWGVELYLSRSSSIPTSGFYLEIAGDDNNAPNPQETTGRTEVKLYSDITTSPSWVALQFEEIPHLEANTVYWIKLIPYYTAGSSHVIWHHDGSGSGLYKSSNETSWTQVTGQAAFRFLPCR